MTEDIEEFEIILLGDSRVGKSSIIKRYVQNTFQDNLISTIGVVLSYKEVIVKDGTKIKLKLIDLSGKEKYRPLNISYYKKAQGVLFIFSYDERESFDHIEVWLNSYKNCSSYRDDIPLILIGNKCDVENRKIEDNLIEELKKRIGINDNVKISAKENIGIEELFKELAEKMYIQNKKYIEKMEKQQRQFAKKLKKQKKKKIVPICCLF